MIVITSWLGWKQWNDCDGDDYSALGYEEDYFKGCIVYVDFKDGGIQR